MTTTNSLASSPIRSANLHQKDLAMTATLTTNTGQQPTTPRTHSISQTANSSEMSAAKVTFGRVVSSEWLKFRTVKSNVIAIGAAAAAAVAFGALFSSLAGSDEGPRALADSALSLSLGGFQLSQLVIAILGVALVAGEYQTGLIRTWFGAAPDRLRVLGAKLGVYGTVALVTSLVAAVVSFLVGQALLPSEYTALTLGSEGVVQALGGTAFYTACIALMGIGLGFLLRSTAAGAGAVVTTLMLAPLMVGLLPSSISDPLGKVLPSNAGTAVQGIESNAELLSAGWGAVVLIGWVAAIVGAAAITLKRRDA